MNNILRKRFGEKEFHDFKKLSDEMRVINNLEDLAWDQKVSRINKLKEANPFYTECIDAIREINGVSKELLAEDKNLANYRDNFIKIYGEVVQSIKIEKNNKILYRSAPTQFNNYITDFHNGIQPQILATEPYQNSLNLPYVNDSAIHLNPESVGWTGGYVCMTSSPNYSIIFNEGGFNKGKDFYMYAMKPKDVTSVAYNIHSGADIKPKQEK